MWFSGKINLVYGEDPVLIKIGSIPGYKKASALPAIPATNGGNYFFMF